MRLLTGEDGRPVLLGPRAEADAFLTHCRGRGIACQSRGYGTANEELVEFAPGVGAAQVRALVAAWERGRRGRA